MKALLLPVFAVVSLFAQDPAKWFQLIDEGERAAKIPDYVAMETKYRAALAEAERFGELDYRVSKSLASLASVLHQRGALAEAEAHYRRALDLTEQSMGRESRQAATILTNLAGVLHGAQHDAEADSLLRHALIIAESSNDEKLTPAVLNSLALVLMGQGEYARAEPVLRRSLALFEKSYGDDSIEAGKAANNLATLYCNTRQHAKAEAEMARALPLYEKHLGSRHPLFAAALANMFTIMSEQHRAEDGAPYLARALAISKLGLPDEAQTAHIQVAAAALAASRGKYQEAASILESVIATQERVLGPTHPELAQSLANYSVVLRRLNQKTESKRAASRANSILKSFR